MPKPSVLALVAFLALGLSPTTSAQEEKPEQKKTIKDYLDVYYHDSAELDELWMEAERRRRLRGPIGYRGYYTPVGLEPGPYYGPPLQIWGRGSGTSLWRNPITGWPLQ